MICKYCFNAHVWAKIPKNEEDYFDNGLDDSNDFSSHGIGHTDKEHIMYFNSGAGKPCNIEIMKLGKDNQWHTIGEYFPKFCPECGRELNEYEIKSQMK